MPSRLRVRRLVALSVAMLPTLAGGYEDQLAAGLDLGYAHVIEGEAGAGIAGGPHAKLGLDDTWNLYVSGMYAFHPTSESPLHAATFGAGIEYVFDVLQWIPYGGLGAEVQYGVQGDEKGAAGGIQLSAGLDYLAARTHSFGIAIRGHALLSDLERFPVYVTVALRFSLLWDL